jgi:hypothetical protein
VDVRVDSSSEPDADELPLPEEWKSLPTLALPDGAHNFLSDTVFFHLPVLNGDKDQVSASSHVNQDRVFCVSCYKQIIASDSLKESDSSITRSTIMKAVVVISRLPFYGLIAAKTESMTRVYFKQHDFKDKSCLIELHSNLNYVLSKSQREILSPTEASLLALSPSRHLISLFGHRVIILLKLLLLEKKVLFFSNLSSNPVPALSNTVTQYQSFSEAAAAAVSGCDGSETVSSVKNLCLIVLTLTSLIPTNFQTYIKVSHLYCAHCQSSPEKDEDKDENNDSESVVIESIPCLELFREGNEIHPYLCLSHIDTITEYKSCVVGATNALFKQKKSSLFDVFVDCQTGKIEFEDPDLKKLLTLSTEDLRFADFLVKHAIICNPSLDPRSTARDVSTDSFDGSDDWLRIQFGLYLLHALRTSFLRDDSKEVSSFNSSFMRNWKKETENYKHWKERFLNNILNKESDADQVEVIIRKSFRNIKPGHPFLSGKNSNVSNVMSDMRLRFMSSSYGSSLFSAQSGGNTAASSSTPVAPKAQNPIPTTTSDRKQAVIDAGRSAISSAKSTFTSWINSYPSTAAGTDVQGEDCPDQPQDLDYQLRFSSLLRRQEEDNDEVVYDRKDFVP